MSDEQERVIRWLVSLAGTLVAAAVIGMAAIIWEMHAQVVTLEVRVEALQNQHWPNRTPEP